MIRGEHFPCQTMDDLAPTCTDHVGWAHANKDAQALWTGGDVVLDG